MPNWYLKLVASDDVGFWEKAPKKFVPAPVVKDVCDKCNNMYLSSLDGYGKELYQKYFENIVYSGESISFRYEYQKLTKWLIKCSYNSARAHNADLEVLDDYAEYLISDKPLPEAVMIYCSLSAPAYFNSSTGKPEMALRLSPEIDHTPEWFRLSVFRLSDFDSIDYCFRGVFINSYLFYLILPKMSVDKVGSRRELIQAINQSGLMADKINISGFTHLKPPQIDSISALTSHMANNPLAYGLYKDSLMQFIKDETPDIIHYIISRDEIISKDITQALEFLEGIGESREKSLLYMQKLEISIHGYERDPRELFEINEVIAYLSALNKSFSNWLFFLHPRSLFLKILLAGLARRENSSVLQSGGQSKAELSTKKIIRHMDHWFISLNKFSHKHSISERMNRKISDDFSELVKSFFN